MSSPEFPLCYEHASSFRGDDSLPTNPGEAVSDHIKALVVVLVKLNVVDSTRYINVPVPRAENRVAGSAARSVTYFHQVRGATGSVTTITAPPPVRLEIPTSPP